MAFVLVPRKPKSPPRQKPSSRPVSPVGRRDADLRDPKGSSYRGRDGREPPREYDYRSRRPLSPPRRRSSPIRDPRDYRQRRPLSPPCSRRCTVLPYCLIFYPFRVLNLIANGLLWQFMLRDTQNSCMAYSSGTLLFMARSAYCTLLVTMFRLCCPSVYLDNCCPDAMYAVRFMGQRTCAEHMHACRPLSPRGRLPRSPPRRRSSPPRDRQRRRTPPRRSPGRRRSRSPAPKVQVSNCLS